MDNDDFEQEFMRKVKIGAAGNGANASPAPSNPGVVASGYVDTTVKSPSSTPEPSAPTSSTKTPKLAWVIILILAIVMVIQAVALVVVLSNNSSRTDNTSAPAAEDNEPSRIEDAPAESAYIYDQEDNLVAIALTCIAEDGTRFALSKDNQFTQYAADSAVVRSGSYTIFNNSLIQLPANNGSPQKILYFDGITLADELKLYECQSTPTEGND